MNHALGGCVCGITHESALNYIAIKTPTPPTRPPLTTLIRWSHLLWPKFNICSKTIWFPSDNVIILKQPLDPTLLEAYFVGAPTCSHPLQTSTYGERKRNGRKESVHLLTCLISVIFHMYFCWAPCCNYELTHSGCAPLNSFLCVFYFIFNFFKHGWNGCWRSFLWFMCLFFFCLGFTFDFRLSRFIHLLFCSDLTN